ncbi:MAG TPA: M48 family metallopeptidase, partial [Paraburkholderia sp.]
MPTLYFSALFVVAVLAMVATKLWLASRQIRYVAAHRDAVPQQFATTIALTAHQRAADYTVARTRLTMVEVVAGAVVLVALTLLGGVQALDLGLSDALGRGYIGQIVLIGVVLVITGAVDLPLDYYRQFVIEARFGFNRMTKRIFFMDRLKGTLIGAAFGIPLLFVVLWLMKQTGSLWWLWTWVVWVVFQMLVLVLYPTFIAPLFNKFEPLKDEALRARIEALMKRCGFAAKGLFVMDGSRRSAHGNAYFTGFGAAKRIVFFDTLLARLSGSEI